MIEPIPALADFFRKMSYALASAFTHDFDMLAPEHMQLEKDDLPEIPNPESPHAYHSRREDEALCCGRQAPPPAFVPWFVPAPGFAPAPGFMPAPAFVPAPAFAPAPVKPERWMVSTAHPFLLDSLRKPARGETRTTRPSLS